MAITSSRTARPQTSYVATSGGTASYATASQLPFVGNQVGDEAFVVDTNKLYVWDGTGWFNVALLNTSPTITTGANVAYNVSQWTPLEVSLAANDPEEVPIQWNYSVSSGSLGNSSVSVNGNTFIVTAGTHSTDVNSVFSLTFTASDGVNIATDGPSQFTVLYADPPGTTHGWIAGGNYPIISIVDRIDYNNDTATASVRGPSLVTRSSAAAAGNTNYGWFGGGMINGSGSTTSSVERIDYAADLVIANNRGPLAKQKRYILATGNTDYGYFAGGYAPDSTVNQIDYTNDAVTASVRGPLAAARYAAAASGNSNYGWFAGSSLTNNRSTVDRVEYLNDLVTASVRGPLSNDRYYQAAIGNDNYGWHGGGRTTTYVTLVDRIDYSNDGVTASVRGSLALIRMYFSATGNNDYGWFEGGYAPAMSTVERIDYANDGITASVRGTLSLSRNYHAAAGGYPG